MSVKLINVDELVRGYFKNTPKVHFKIEKAVDALGHVIDDPQNITVVIKCGDDCVKN